MEKKRIRVITGWRQVTRRPGFSKSRPVPLLRTKTASAPRAAAVDTAAKERWEAEGGNLVEAAKATVKP